MKIAVFGCIHGAFDRMYDYAQDVDLILCTGDLQTLRDKADMETMKCPAKYKSMGDFQKYYTGQVPVPIPTICIGGNHEAVGYLRELRYGGWLAPNMYFLGSSGVVRAGSLRIGGISGVHKPSAYTSPLENPPFNARSMETAYGTRQYDIDLLRQVAEPLDVMLSHDWPDGM